MNEILQDTIEKIAAAAEAEGVDLSPEELATLAYEKIAQESEEGESSEQADGESEEKEKEEGEEEEKTEGEEKEGSFDNASLVEAYEEATKEAVDAVAAEAPDLDAEDTAKMAAEVVEGIFQEKVAELLEKQAKSKILAKVKSKAKAVSKWGRGFVKRHPKITHAGKVTGLLGAGAGGGYLASRLLAGKEKKSSVQGLYNRLHAKTASAGSYEDQVVKTAREFLILSGFDPNTGKLLDKIALAKTPEEKVKVGALTLLEQNGWPVQWDPRYLARALEEG